MGYKWGVYLEKWGVKGAGKSGGRENCDWDVRKESIFN